MSDAVSRYNGSTCSARRRSTRCSSASRRRSAASDTRIPPCWRAADHAAGWIHARAVWCRRTRDAGCRRASGRDPCRTFRRSRSDREMFARAAARISRLNWSADGERKSSATTVRVNRFGSVPAGTPAGVFCSRERVGEVAAPNRRNEWERAGDVQCNVQERVIVGACVPPRSDEPVATREQSRAFPCRSSSVAS